MSSVIVKIEEIAQLDLYPILHVKSNATIKDIKKNYKKLILRYHPDKGHKKNPVKFERVKQAFTILSNEDLRKKYDALHQLYSKPISEISELKDDFKKFNQKKLSAEEQALNELDFKAKWDQLNNQHKYDPENRGVIPLDDMANQYNKLQYERDSLKVEFDNSYTFDTSKFNTIDFNTKFNEYCNTKYGADSTVLTTHNTNATALVGNFAGLDQQNLYTEQAADALHSKSSSLNDAFTLPSAHVMNTQIDKKSVKDRLKEYEQQTQQFKSMKVKDFTPNDFMGCGIIDNLINDTPKLLRTDPHVDTLDYSPTDLNIEQS
ncbi:MAG: DnaJ domain protein [Faunusvirus sp.]|jgi:curved DNA-binding protein CbpA|uniref:DnaJ domain protein n=1 Tax=Faunusvirus sp. TaxID=2487766 RepID=A0A3G4ZXX6_9VIRU|nr:MAG: DnaJ domain protein [Faunusvirus sp.]